MISQYCAQNNTLIPVAFVLGFYVSLIMTRWWNQLGHIPWPDHMAMFVTANVHGLDERGRLMRRTMLRYINLAYAITMSSISTAVKKRFPTFQHFVDAGLMMQNEKEILAKIQTPHNKFFIPLGWTTSLVNRARKEGRIKDDFAVKTLIDEINTFRMHLATLFVYDMISVPLVYTQVVTIAVYMFFLACLMGRQFLDNIPDSPDLYFPLFTFLEYLFYMGWLKVAECFVNPFGEDEDDFDINYLIDRNLQVSYLIVDEIHDEHPDLIRDQYWDNVVFDMPYTKSAEPYRMKQPHLGSAIDLSKSYKDKEFIMSKTSLDQIDEMDESGGMKRDLEHGGGDRPKRIPLHSSSQSRSATSFGSHRGSYQQRRQFSRLSEHCESPTTPFVPGSSYVEGVPDSSIPTARSPTPKVFSPSSPPTAVTLSGPWGATNTPLVTPLTPDAEFPTQFHMDELENEDATETDALLKGELSPDALELKAIINRHNTQPAGDDATTNEGRRTSTTSCKTLPTTKPLETVAEKSPEVDESSSQKGPQLSLVIPGSSTAVVSPPEESLEPTISATGSTAEAEEPSDSDKTNSPRRRFVPPPLQSPEIPPTPALTTPVWVLAPQLHVSQSSTATPKESGESSQKSPQKTENA
jgi:bestrophin-3